MGSCIRRHIIEEIGHGHVENLGDLKQPTRGHTIGAVFIFLNLLERNSEALAKLFLVHAQ